MGMSRTTSKSSTKPKSVSKIGKKATHKNLFDITQCLVKTTFRKMYPTKLGETNFRWKQTSIPNCRNTNRVHMISWNFSNFFFLKLMTRLRRVWQNQKLWPLERKWLPLYGFGKSGGSRVISGKCGCEDPYFSKNT